MNEAFAARVGRPRAGLLDRPLEELIGAEMARGPPPPSRPAGDPTDRPSPGGFPTTARTKQFTDERLEGIFAVTVTPLINQDGEPVGRVLVARDITAQTQLETEREALRGRLAQSEKLASLGQFVAGIAHEMNNPLQGVLGHLELLIDTSEAARPVRPTLRRIYQEGDRAAKIVRNLLVFTGVAADVAPALRIDRVLGRALASRSAARRRGRIEVSRDQADNVPDISGDPLLLQQALLNILINAEHAIAGDGRAGAHRDVHRSVERWTHGPADDSRHGLGHSRPRSCRASSIRSSRRRRSARARASGWRLPTGSSRSTAARSTPSIRRKEAPASSSSFPRSWRRKARSTGKPRPRAKQRDATTRQRVNSLIEYVPTIMDESFLTTEEVLDYLQVNLRTVYRLIKAGKIPAVRVGRQWRFRKRDIDAWLESQRPRAIRPAATSARVATPAAGRPRVLVVDDEASIRDLLAKTLALAEYDVDLASDGRTGLERLRMIPYDLLITDLKMPGVDGLAVIREARRLKADIPVIIITGFSTEASAIEAVNLGVSGYLTKPFRVPRVLAAAAKALGE